MAQHPLIEVWAKTVQEEVVIILVGICMYVTERQYCSIVLCSVIWEVEPTLISTSLEKQDLLTESWFY
jgi:uncharacterized membrane protein